MFSLPTFEYNAKISDCSKSDGTPQLIQLKWGCILINEADKSTTVVVLQNNTVRHTKSSKTVLIVTKKRSFCIEFETEAIAIKCFKAIKTCTSWKINDFYDFDRRLGTGSFGIVYQTFDKSGNLHAAKVCRIREIREIEVLCMPETNHYVMSARDVLITNTITYIVLPLMRSDLRKVSQTRRHLFTEEAVRSVMRQLLEGLEHLHHHGIVHCDLKPANILCNIVDNKQIQLKIGDFGASDFLNGRMYVSHINDVTTYQYCAPEQAYGLQYGAKADIFAAGSIMYELCVGKMAYNGDNAKEIYDAILSIARPQLPKDFSQNAKDFFAWIHSRNEFCRPTAEMALKHRWFQVEDTQTSSSRKQ